jgi:hypothetical protein
MESNGGDTMIGYANPVHYLKESPMFQLSLTSKELFHSNFISWVLTNYSKECSPVFAAYLQEGDDFTITNVKREEGNKDINIYFRHEAGLTKKLIIENKVKSLPNYEQLAKYTTNDPDESYVLLSLISPPFSQNNKVYIPEFNKEWTCINYQDLAHQLQDVVSAIEAKNPYHANIVLDYIGLVSSLHQLTQDAIGDIQAEHYNYYRSSNKDLESFREIRMHDFFLKLKHEMIALEFYQAIEERFPHLHLVPTKRWEEAQADEVFVGSGFTNGSGLSEMKYVITETANSPIILGIQIQGTMFRMFVEGEKKVSLKIAETLRTNGLWFDFSKAIELGVTEREEYPKPGKQNKKFNTYSQTFFYKYTKLQECQNANLIELVCHYLAYLNENKSTLVTVINEAL